MADLEEAKALQRARFISEQVKVNRLPRAESEVEVLARGFSILDARRTEPAPVPMLLTCPSCSERHIDEGEFATKPHHTHACQRCGMCWRPALVPTVGVQFLPGFKNGDGNAK